MTILLKLLCTIVMTLGISFQYATAQKVIHSKAEYISIVNSDQDLSLLSKEQFSLLDKASTLGVLSLAALGLTGLSAVIHYESNEQTSRALTSLPVKLFGGFSIISGALGTIQYLFAKAKERKIYRIINSRYDTIIDISSKNSNGNMTLGLVINF